MELRGLCVAVEALVQQGTLRQAISQPLIHWILILQAKNVHPFLLLTLPALQQRDTRFREMQCLDFPNSPGGGLSVQFQRIMI